MAKALCRARGVVATADATAADLYVRWLKNAAAHMGADLARIAQIPPMDAAHAADGIAVIPFVSHDEWMARCSAYPLCWGATGVCRDLLYMCPNCLNALVDGKWLRVAWPSQEVQDRIDVLLEARPFKEIRNYRPELGDTVATLEQDNRRKPWLTELGQQQRTEQMRRAR